MREEIKRELEKWYKNYCRENRRFPTWGELVSKAEEIASEYGLEEEAEEFASNF